MADVLGWADRQRVALEFIEACQDLDRARVAVERDVLEGLVRVAHQRSGRTCACGWGVAAPLPGVSEEERARQESHLTLRALHRAHLEFEVREALAGRCRWPW